MSIFLVGIEQIDQNKRVNFLKYNFGFDCGLISSLKNQNNEPYKPCATFSRIKTKNIAINPISNALKNINISLMKPNKITDVRFSKWTPKSRKVGFDNTILIKSFSTDFQGTTVSSSNGYLLPGLP